MVLHLIKRAKMRSYLLLKTIAIIAVVITLTATLSFSQQITVKGQLSGWTGYNSKMELPLTTGGRYLPQINSSIKLSRSINGTFGNLNAEIEIAGNIFGNGDIKPFSYSQWDGDAKLYRGWLKLSSNRSELRLGLQKINFGSATLLRPLMWFDKVDARDPLQFTNGVWGALGRYYLRNNSNIWLWVLYGNKEGGAMDLGEVNPRSPEYGGRVQLSIPRGEAAFTYHHRKADLSAFSFSSKIKENRFAFDIKLDLTVGVWIESSWINRSADLDILSNQTLINLGTDYTFKLGNGLNLIAEHLILSYDIRAFQFSSTANLSALSANYPMGINDNISYILYYDWKNGGVYNFVNWRHTFREFSLHIMGYINPSNTLISLPTNRNSNFSGNGIQIMLVYNHQTKKILNKLIN